MGADQTDAPRRAGADQADRQALLEALRGHRRRRVDVVVAERPLEHYDALIPA